MFKKILIANRGEIAVRIMATCREMGIRSVAVYSEADTHARHVLNADEAYAIGPAPATQSYLNGTKILEVARESGAEAIHPGYGFLSENADFAAACEQAGIVFIGPSAATIRLMGSKIAAKQVAQRVNAPTVPGYSGESQEIDVLEQAAERIGFPLLIKASAGGGGKGMRVVQHAKEFAEQLAGARREAQAAFGDSTVFLERYLQQPRHIEIQILADAHGHIIHLGERECSIQRRHQKIIEESPSVALTPALRAHIGNTAIDIARAANYVNAGTLEFMLDEDHRFYFLEMNTRLQVEHPVTELTTGLDLVRQQLRIAAGEPLGFSQTDIVPRGHAIEARLYAEDPHANFLPSTGKITSFIRPEGPGIRMDSGVGPGDEVSQYYDPMLAKLVVYGENRFSAIARLQHALEQCVILGVTTNISLLHAISCHPAFYTGQTPTNFLETQHLLPTENEAAAATLELPETVLIAAAIQTIQPEIERDRTGTNPWQTLGPWRTVGGVRTFIYRYHQQVYHVAIQPGLQRHETWKVSINQGTWVNVTSLSTHEPLIVLRLSGIQMPLYVQVQAAEIQVSLAGHIYRLQRQQPPEITNAAQTSSKGHLQKRLNAPMSGTIVKVLVQDGDIVEANQVLLLLSAMKMEHAITAPYAGKVLRIHYPEGAVVQGGVIVVEMEEES